METTKGRITGESMKISIISTSRTCSSVIEGIHSKKYNLELLSEFFSDGPMKLDVRQKVNFLKEHDNYTIKITSTSLKNFPDVFSYNTFPWNIFDKIVLTERENLANQCASWLLLSYAQINNVFDNTEVSNFIRHKLKTPHDIPFIKGHLNYALDDIVLYHFKIKPLILKMNSNTPVIQHELLQLPHEVCLPILSEKLGFEVTSSMLGKIENPLDYTPFIEAHNLEEIIKTKIIEMIHAPEN